MSEQALTSKGVGMGDELDEEQSQMSLHQKGLRWEMIAC
jgi:hypothetical protein